MGRSTSKWGTLDGSVQALVDAHRPGADPRVLVADLTQALHVEMLGRAPTPDDLPTSLEMAASFHGAEIEHVDAGAAGSVRFEADRYKIRVNSGQSAGRIRFTTAHEISHIQFMKASGAIERRDDELTFEWSGQEEYLCDLGAAELLLPASAVGALLPRRPDIDDVIHVAKRCDTSIEAALRRVAEFCGLPASAVVLEPRLKPTEIRQVKRNLTSPTLSSEFEQATPKPRLRVNYAVDFGVQIPPHKSVDDGCPLVEAVVGQNIEFVGQTGLTRQHLAVSARLMPFNRSGRVVERVVALVFNAEAWRAAA